MDEIEHEAHTKKNPPRPPDVEAKMKREWIESAAFLYWWRRRRRDLAWPEPEVCPRFWMHVRVRVRSPAKQKCSEKFRVQDPRNNLLRDSRSVPYWNPRGRPGKLKQFPFESNKQFRILIFTIKIQAKWKKRKNLVWTILVYPNLHEFNYTRRKKKKKQK